MLVSNVVRSAWLDSSAPWWKHNAPCLHETLALRTWDVVGSRRRSGTYEYVELPILNMKREQCESAFLFFAVQSCYWSGMCFLHQMSPSQINIWLTCIEYLKHKRVACVSEHTLKLAIYQTIYVTVSTWSLAESYTHELQPLIDCHRGGQEQMILYSTICCELIFAVEMSWLWFIIETEIF